MSNLEFRDVHSPAVVRFSNLQAQGRGAYDEVRFLVEIEEAQMSARVEVLDVLSTTWEDFFAGLAECRKGWSDERSLSSIEDHLNLTATCDSLGHVSLRVAIRENPLYRGWRAETTVNLELGQLDDLAKQAREFFSAAV